MYDDNYVSSVPYRLMPPRKQPRSELREALEAAKDTGSIREALNAADGAFPEPADSAGGLAWPDAVPAREPRARRLGRTLTRANWVLILAIVGTIGTVAGRSSHTWPW
jgi:hypothetical protein